MDFTVSGSIKMGSGKRSFTRTISADTENAAREKTFALFGSHNGLLRTMVRIDKVEKKKVE